MKRLISFPPVVRGFLARLAEDRAGNTLALIAAAMIPLLAIVGSGVDMGRAYVVQTRLQQACDSAVLAARKRLGSEVVTTGVVPAEVAATGNRFFNLNFRDGSYATYDRTFQMALENDFSVSGHATIEMPMAVMQVFGQDEMPIAVTCASILNFQNLDVMMSIDVTGSMRHTNAGDTLSRLESVKAVIRNFYGQLEGAKGPETRIRYGFVPYATNVNVGGLLEDDWMVDEWTYQSREATGVTLPAVARTDWINWRYVSGTRPSWTDTGTSYVATWNPPPSPDQTGWYSCSGSQPSNTLTQTDVLVGGPTVAVQLSPPAVVTTENYRRTENGTRYRTVVTASTCKVQQMVSTNYVETFEKVTSVPSADRIQYRYKPIARDVSNWRAEAGNTCIEERKSTAITDFSSVDLSQNPDLDINLVPDPGNPDTQWRPRYPSAIYARKIMNNGTGSWSRSQVVTTDTYAQTGTWWFSDCPPAASKLAERTLDELNAYLATLVPYGATYHDIGMIWGGRLLSQRGLFASENANVSTAQPTSRHLIFLTDGQTEPYDMAYGAYGLEPLDMRRWDSSSPLSLAQTIEQRFKFACEEVKKNNTTVWVIAFGTYANEAMRECAGTGRYFEAANSSQLNEAFVAIAKSMGDLRISR
ncbi:pilus assembly protein TadG-related protein [Erythrobacter sp. SDW2]|uniref:Tad domain-containing protein n=1 Tax=Erythrobacter sp. SDW2 TaxID=2907154 RepID=UPI001F41F6E1|nr:TadE/TadG family type IV pilus assembly protein [Erythrobacter sp. SDW2]UIP05731.1 pilus assembly protein TadG-related protein [Erythrobacter sp. SDW2]